MAISTRGAFSRNSQSCHGVASASQASKSTTSPSQPLAMASFSASIIGAKRSWKLTAAVSCLARQISRIRVASARSPPIGFWISATAPSGSASSTSAWRDRRRGEVEDRVLDRGRFLDRARMPSRPIARQASRALALIGIVEPGDRKAALPVGREMRVADDRAGAEGDDRARLRRHRPGLTREVGQSMASSLPLGERCRQADGGMRQLSKFAPPLIRRSGHPPREGEGDVGPQS